MIINTVRFLGSRIAPNPIEIDYWVDTQSDPYGSIIKYYDGNDWVILSGGGLDVDLSNYYTKLQVDSRISSKADITYVNDNIAALDLKKADALSVYTKTEVDDKFSSLTKFDESKYYTKVEIDNKGYLTSVPAIYITNDELNEILIGYPSFEYVYSKAEVDQKITDAITSGTVDLSNYYTKPEVDALIPTDYITSIPSEYITESELNAKGYLTAVPSEFVTESELNAKGYLLTVPSEYVTETELNAKGYLTEHQSLANYYTKGEVDTLIEDIDIPDVDLSDYYNKTATDLLLATKANTIDVYDKATVDLKITDAVTGGTVDLSNYYNKLEVDAKIPDVSVFITSEDLPTNVGELNNDVGYITLSEVPTTDLTGYATENWVESKGYLTEHLDISSLATKTELTSGLATKQDTITDLATIRANANLGASALQSIPAEYITETEMNSVLSGKQDIISDLANIRSGAAKGATALQSHQDISHLATKTELTNAQTASQTYADNAIAALVNGAPETLNTLNELATAITEHQDVTDALDEAITKKADKTELPTKVSELENDSEYITNDDISGKQDKGLKFTNLNAETWVEDDTYSEYPYRCDLSCSGVVETDYAEVVFSLTDAVSGDYAPICETKDGIVSIWAKINGNVLIPTIIITR